ncbi:MAG: ribose 5-phosphate isomerase B [Pseudomonadota bacterium]
MPPMLVVALGCDHAGYPLKDEVRRYVESFFGTRVTDVGCSSPQSVDYPVYAAEVARRVASGEAERGIIICGSGVGMSMVANRFKGVRAVLANDLFTAQMSRRHNDANVLCLGARTVGVGLALEIIKTFMETPFEGGRHQRRVELIDTIVEQKGV